MVSKIKEETFCPTNREDWREWLRQNHDSCQSIWLVYYKASSVQFNLSWSEAVEEALCFGWIDSVKRTIDAERFMQFFSKRKSNSTWSRINKEKVRQLIENNRMAESGFESIEIARQNGSWTILDQVEQLIIPDDLEIAFQNKIGAKEYFLGLSKSDKKAILQWLVLAKKEETRAKRVEEVADLAYSKMKPKQFRKL